MSKQEDEEEINIDFSKITKFFKKSKKHKKVKEEISSDEEEISIDFTKVKKFTKKYSMFLLILIPIFLAIFFRAYPASLPITDDWAKSSVYNSIQTNILNEINQQYPNLPDINKQRLVEEQFNILLKENKADIEPQVEQLSNYFKSRLQDDSGQTYLLAIDPYLWYGFARNYDRNKHFGNEIIDGESRYTLRGLRADRLGSKVSFNINSFFLAKIHKIIKIFNPNQTVMASVFLAPIILMALAIIPAFFIGYRLKGKMAGFFTALLIAINPSIIGRTAGGFSDTDPYHILFPLLAIWMLIELLKRDSWKEKVVFSSLLGLTYVIYSKIWMAWFVFDIIIGAIILNLILQYFIKHKNLKKDISSIFIFLGSASIFNGIYVLLTKSGSFFGALIEVPKTLLVSPLQALAVKDVAVTTLWPNVLTTVAELNKGSIGQIINTIGGKFLLALSLISIIIMAYVSIKKRKPIYMALTGLIIAYYFVVSTATTLAGMRFAMFIIPPFAISIGYLLDYIIHKLPKTIKKGIQVNETISKTIVFIICILVVSPQLMQASNIGKSEIPSMNDAWYTSLTKIKDNTSDAIITSWWDFGHWFVAIAERRVTFDGGDQGERIHWVGKSLLVNEENTSIGLLRILNCGQERPPHILEDIFNDDTVKSIDILNKIVLVNDKTTAIEILKQEGLSESQIDDVIKVTYCEDLIEQYYITSEDMVGKAGVWAHFGSWNFHKASMYQSVKKLDSVQGTELLKNKFNLTEEQSSQYYYEIQSTEADRWISPWPSYVSGQGPCQKQENNTLICSNNVGGQGLQFKIDLNTMEATLPTSQGEIYPYSITYATNNSIKEKTFENPEFPYSIILIPQDNGFKNLLSMPELASSTFTKLFFFEGHGMECFSKFDERNQITGGKIQVWKVDFDCQQENHIYFQEKTEENIIIAQAEE